MTRLVRRISALFAIGALLFAQLAVSAYACPVESVAQAVTSSASTDDAHCVDLQSPNLCDRHCADESSVTAQATGGSFAAFVPTSLTSRIEETSPAVMNVRDFDAAFLRFEPPRPLTLFGVLRI